MKADQIKMQLQVNRKLLADMHEKLESAKELRKYWDHFEVREYAYNWHKQVVENSKRVAKLVTLQKALKKDLSRELAYERAARQMALMKASCMANVGEMF